MHTPQCISNIEREHRHRKLILMTVEFYGIVEEIIQTIVTSKITTQKPQK
ncbi:hypothetical protein OH687_13435 [Burkholderia anthina]|nr:hypothetical protein OH687_13435 [Burkholderia anthina]